MHSNVRVKGLMVVDSFVFGFVIFPILKFYLTLSCSYTLWKCWIVFRTIANLDVKIDFVPPSLINFIARQLIGNGHKLFQKVVYLIT